MKNIDTLNFSYLTIGAIPSSYLVSMTYEEQLLYLLNKLDKEIVPVINELIKEFSQYDDHFDEIFERLTIIENKLTLFNEELNSVKSNINQLDNKIEINTSNINLLNQKIDNEINNLRVELENIINNDYDILKEYIDYNDNILNEKIDNIQIGLINVYDPTTGMIQPLQTTINNLYQLTNKDGLTASEFDLLDLTATEFDAYQITAYQFDSAGKTILV